jgi:hypothetical protein
MLKVQVKHENFDSWTILLPGTNTKADKDQIVFAMTSRIQYLLTERRCLGDDAYVFGSERAPTWRHFDSSWKCLFRLADLPCGGSTVTSGTICGTNMAPGSGSRAAPFKR